MGDVVLASSAVEYLASHYPSATLGLVTSCAYAELFDRDPRLARVYSYDRRAPELNCDPPDPVSTWDWVVDLQCNRHSRCLIQRLHGAPSITRFNKLRFRRLLLLFLRLDLYDHRRNVVARYLEAARAAPEERVSPRIYLAPRYVESARRAIQSPGPAPPLLALAPYSAWRNKQWPTEYFAEVGKHFIARQWRVAILGGPEDASVATRLQRQLGEGSVSLAGRASIAESAGALARAELVLANDTGLFHLARALGRRAGVVYGATTSHFGFFPFGPPPYRVFERELPCRPCHPHGGNVCLLRSRPCLRRISPREVIAGLEELHGQPMG